MLDAWDYDWRPLSMESGQKPLRCIDSGALLMTTFVSGPTRMFQGI